MSYNVSYTQLPLFPTSAIGVPFFATTSGTNAGWNSIYFGPSSPTYLDALPIGVYSVTANVLFDNSPNAFGYILVDGSNNTNPSNIMPLSDYTEFQSDIKNYSPSGISSYLTDYVVASQQMRNGAPGSSSALSLSTQIYVKNATNSLTFLFYNQTSGYNWIAELIATRLA